MDFGHARFFFFEVKKKHNFWTHIQRLNKT